MTVTTTTKAMTKKQLEAEQRDAAIAQLRALIKPGTTIHTILRHVSASGMQRCISLVMHTPEGIVELDWRIARAGWEKFHPKHGGLVANGCGMDMGFHLVYNLGLRLWPTGTPEPHGTRNGQPDTNGGYALKQVWL
jgi:hypothetical protein